jgi:hypothetical protein
VSETLSDYVWEVEQATEALAVAEVNCDWSAAMSAQRRIMEALQEIAPMLVERGVNAGMSQKRMADLMGIPASTLRGAKREFSR